MPDQVDNAGAEGELGSVRVLEPQLALPNNSGAMQDAAGQL